MHTGRSRIEIVWTFAATVPNLATYTMPVGGAATGFNCGVGVDIAPVLDLPYFSIDVYTNRAVQVWIETANNVGRLATMVILTCGAVLQRNTIYDVPPPHNKDGYLVITSNWLRIRVDNQTGEDADPFELVARAWK